MPLTLEKYHSNGCFLSGIKCIEYSRMSNPRDSSHSSSLSTNISLTPMTFDEGRTPGREKLISTVPCVALLSLGYLAFRSLMSIWSSREKREVSANDTARDLSLTECRSVASLDGAAILAFRILRLVVIFALVALQGLVLHHSTLEYSLLINYVSRDMPVSITLNERTDSKIY